MSRTAKVAKVEKTIPVLTTEPAAAFGEPDAKVPAPTTKPDETATPANQPQQTRVHLTLDATAQAAFQDRNSDFHKKFGFVGFLAMLIAAANMVDAGELAGTPITEGKDAGKIAVTIDTATLMKLGEKVQEHRSSHGNGKPATRANHPGNGSATINVVGVRSQLERIADAVRKVEAMKENNKVQTVDYTPFVTKAHKAKLDAEDAVVAATEDGKSPDVSEFADQAEAALAGALSCSYDSFYEYVSGILEREGLGLSGENTRKLIVRVGKIDSDVKAGIITPPEGKKQLFAVKEAALSLSNMERRSNDRGNRPDRSRR